MDLGSLPRRRVPEDVASTALARREFRRRGNRSEFARREISFHLLSLLGPALALFPDNLSRKVLDA